MADELRQRNCVTAMPKRTRRGAGGHTRPRLEYLRQPNSPARRQGGEVGHFCSRELLPSLNVCGLGFHCLGEKALSRQAGKTVQKTLVCKEELRAAREMGTEGEQRQMPEERTELFLNEGNTREELRPARWGVLQVGGRGEKLS